MKKSTLALVVMGVVASTSVHAAEVYNKNGNKLDVYGKVKAMHYLSDDDAKDGDQTYVRFGFKGETQINDQLTGYGRWEAEFAGNKAESDSSVYYSPNNAASQETDRESAANSANFKEYETFFTVRAYNGSVAVFKDGNDVPLYCIETPLSSLTEEDRRLLARGIRAETLSEACKLIEDYE